MTLLLLILLPTILIFLFYYELIWKKFEREKGKGLLGMAADLAFSDEPAPATVIRAGKTKPQNPWEDWKYRLMVELHRRGQIKPEEGAQIVGVSAQEVERYLDKLAEKGKVQSAGDSERGLFYRIVNEA